MESNFKKFTALALALALTVAAVGAVTAAPGSIDGSQTDTTTEVHVAADKTMDANFNASGDTTWNMTVQSVPDSDSLAMNVSHQGEDLYEFTGTFGTYADGDPDATATTNGRYHTFTDDEFSSVPMATNENVTLNITYWNPDAATPAPTTIQVYVENGDERTVGEVNNGSAFSTVETRSPAFYKVFTSDYTATEIDDTRNINGSNTTVVYSLDSPEVQDSFTNATESASESGDLTMLQASADGDTTETVPVFYRSAPSWYNVSDHGTMAVYNPTANTLSFTLSPESFDGRTVADLNAETEMYDTWDVYTVYKLAGGSDNDGMEAVMNVVMG